MEQVVFQASRQWQAGVSALPPVEPRRKTNYDSGIEMQIHERALFRGFETYGHLREESSKDTCDVMRGEVVVFPLYVLAILRK